VLDVAVVGALCLFCRLKPVQICPEASTPFSTASQSGCGSRYNCESVICLSEHPNRYLVPVPSRMSLESGSSLCTTEPAPMDQLHITISALRDSSDLVKNQLFCLIWTQFSDLEPAQTGVLYTSSIVGPLGDPFSPSPFTRSSLHGTQCAGTKQTLASHSTLLLFPPSRPYFLPIYLR